MESSIPTPPYEGHHARPNPTSRKSQSSAKAAKPTHRVSKRASTSTHSHSHPSPPHEDSAAGDVRQKRVWKACERCRMKKTKCDGEFPCKRCKDDGLVCTAGSRKMREYKQLPKGYAEVLEYTQLALVATVHKLYSMVRSSQPWELGEPELNERGQPVIHNIAAKLGCIRPNADFDLPSHSVFPEDEAGMARLAAELEMAEHSQPATAMEASSSGNRTERASSSELDHSDFEQDYRRAVFGGGGGGGGGPMTLSPASLTYNDFDVQSDYAVPSPTIATSAPYARAPAAAAAAGWDSGANSRPNSHVGSRPISTHFVAAPPYMNLDMLSQGLLESNFGAIKPHVVSCPNPEVMMGMGDPMIYSGYDLDSLRLESARGL